MTTESSSYEVARSEFVKNPTGPLMTLMNNKIQTNAMCQSALGIPEYIHLLISREEHCIALTPAPEYAHDAIRWNRDTSKARSSSLKTPIIYAMIMDMMEWNPLYKYRLTGHIEAGLSEKLLVFDLSAPEIFIPELMMGDKPIYTPDPQYQKEWMNHFGVDFTEHENQVLIKRHAEYTVIEINQRRTNENEKDTL